MWWGLGCGERVEPRVQTRPTHTATAVQWRVEVAPHPSFPGPCLQRLPTVCPQIQESEHIKVENSESGSKLTILAARQEHCGCYTLLVENKLGSRQAQVNLTVVGESGWVAWQWGMGKVESPQAG